jgi:hypothetical protein
MNFLFRKIFPIMAILFFILTTQPVKAQVLRNTNTFNPDISANILGRYRHASGGSNNRTDSLRNGLSFEESELQLSADVDAYFRAKILLGISQEDGTTEFAIEPEEVFFETLSIPNLTFKAGKFRSSFGRHNTLHPHAFPFIDAPMINDDLLGEESFNDIGVSAAVLLPTPWFGEFTLQGLGTGNDILFNSGDSKNIATVGYLKNLWELSNSLTFELGLYGTRGANQFTSTTYAYGSDIVFKYRSMQGGETGGKYKALIWQTQYIGGIVDQNPAGEKIDGIASWLQYQFAQRWWIQAREEWNGLNQSAIVPDKNKQSALLSFFPSEFSGFRIQYDTTKTQGLPREHAVTLQYSLSLGAHPVHAY